MKKCMFALSCASLTFATAHAQMSGHVEIVKGLGDLSVWRLSTSEGKTLRMKHEAFKNFIAIVTTQVIAKGVFTPATEKSEAHYTYKTIVVGSGWVRIEKPDVSIHFEKSGDISICENREQIKYHYLDGVNDTATIFGEHYVQDVGNSNSYAFDTYMPQSAYSKTIAYLNRMEKELKQQL